MTAAIKSVTEFGMPVKRAATQHGVPRRTLMNYLKHPDRNIDACGLGGFDPVFSPQQEDELVQHILNMEQRLFGLTTRDIRSLAFQLAVKNGIKHPFNTESQLAGEDWLHGFRQRISKSNNFV